MMDINNKKCFYIIGTGSDYIKLMWNDVLKYENIFFVDIPIKKSFRFKWLYNLIESKLYSYKVNRRFNLIGKKIWRKYYSTENINFRSQYDNIIIFSDAMRILTDVKYWIKLKQKYKLTYCMLLLNSCKHDFNATESEVKKILDYLPVDKIFTFDIGDAKRFNLEFFTSIYSKLNVDHNGEIMYDFYFVGQKKNRYRDIIDVYKWLKMRGYTCLFRITGVNENEKIDAKDIIYNQNISYKEVITELSKAKAIVDINISGQKGLSLRFFEALLYNKYLLTNNKSVKNTSYYNRNYMFYFEKFQQTNNIPFLPNDKVQYNYNNDFSPIILLKKIENLLKESNNG